MDPADLSGAGMLMLSLLGPAARKLSAEYRDLQNSLPRREDVFLVHNGPGR